MDCVGVSGSDPSAFGCKMQEMGGWTGEFLFDFGNPAFSFVFLLLLAGFIVLLFMAIRNALST
jgi:hypothetical protein